MITPAQCRAARALLDWSQRQLASAAQIGVSDVGQFERNGARRRPATIGIVRRALEAAGVEFIAENGGGPGVRLRKGAEALG
jgi:transcriptional regulator with XRE-family HTH domain